MTHTYKITGMTCGRCEAKVKNALLLLPHITAVEVSKASESATISMDQHISLATLQQALYNKYSITAMEHSEVAELAKSWFATYKPVFLIFFYTSVVSVIVASTGNGFRWMMAMNVFMAGFFLTFSFFKMLDVKGFAESYAVYDIIAGKFNAWGYIYVFVEFALGLAYAANFQPILTNIITLTIMSVSIAGVLRSVLNKRKIQCACLGAVFNLPMSTLTIIEDALMIVMSVIMILSLY
ncbi:MAG: MauE/DoxX family redox-associated membrane protein [Ferruginibacter sp.]